MQVACIIHGWRGWNRPDEKSWNVKSCLLVGYATSAFNIILYSRRILDPNNSSFLEVWKQEGQVYLFMPFIIYIFSD